jgi:hypothetical protein
MYILRIYLVLLLNNANTVPAKLRGQFVPGINDANIIIENATASASTVIKKTALGGGILHSYNYLRLVSHEHYFKKPNQYRVRICISL